MGVGPVNSILLGRDVAVRPGLPRERRMTRRRWDGTRLESSRQLDTGVAHLRARGDLEVAIAGQPCLVTASLGAEGVLGRDIADAAVGQGDREGEREAAVGFDLQ